MPILPDKTIWANLNPTDPISLQPAIIEPSIAKKNNGFVNVERPPRQDLNWIQNNNGLWNSLSFSHMKGHISGLNIIETNVVVNDSYVDVSKGNCMSSDGEYFFDTEVDNGFPTVMRKWILKSGSSSWVKGSDQAGITPSIAPIQSDTWYHAFIILLNDGDIDLVFDDDAEGNNIDLDFTDNHKRRIFSLRTDTTSKLDPVKQFGDYFDLGPRFGSASIVLDQSTPDVTLPLGHIPSGIKTFANIRLRISGNANSGSLITFAGEGETPATPNSSSAYMVADLLGVGSQPNLLMKGFNPEIKFKTFGITNPDSVNISVFSLGYTDVRGKELGF